MDEKVMDTNCLSCQPCLADQKQVIASFFCLDCNECHCLKCKEVHRRFSCMKGHLIVNIEPSFTQGHINRFHKYCTCKVHNLKIEFICSKYNVLCCTMCKQEKHRSCSDIQDIGDVIKRSPDNFWSLKRKADGLRNKAITVSKYLNETTKKLDDGSEMWKLQKVLDDTKEKLFKKIDSFVNDMLESGRRRIESESKYSFKELKQTEKVIASLDEMFEDIDCWNQTPAPLRFILRHRLTEVFIECEENTKNISERLRSPGEFNLLLDNKMESLVNYKHSFGNVYLKHKSVAINEITDHRAVRIELLQIKSLRRRALDQTEFVPDITGMSFLEDGRLVVIDKTNRHIRLHDKHSVDRKWKTDDAPIDVALLEGSKFAVIFRRCLVLYEVENDELNSYNTIQTLKQNDTISVKDKSSYVIGVSGDKNPAMLITESGHEIDLNLQLNDCSRYISKSLFFKTNVAEFIAISFKDSNGVVLKDMQTKEFQFIENKNLVKPGYMCIGPFNTIFVCCDSGKIVHLTTEGTVLATLSTDIQEPKCIAMSRDNNELAVAGNGQILTYKIIKV